MEQSETNASAAVESSEAEIRGCGFDQLRRTEAGCARRRASEILGQRAARANGPASGSASLPNLRRGGHGRRDADTLFRLCAWPDRGALSARFARERNGASNRPGRDCGPHGSAGLPSSIVAAREPLSCAANVLGPDDPRNSKPTSWCRETLRTSIFSAARSSLTRARGSALSLARVAPLPRRSFATGS